MSSTDKTKLPALAALFIAFPRQEREGTEKQLLDVYLMAVEGITSDFTAMACKRFIQGQVERSNLAFRPTPPELAVECRRLRDKALDTDRLTALRLPKPESNDPPEATPGERRRSAEMWQRAKAEIQTAAAALGNMKRPWTPPSSEQIIASRDRIAAYMAAKDDAA